MKRIFLIALLFISLGAKAQKDTIGLNIPIKEGEILYEGVVNVPGKSKQILYDNAKQWFVDYFVSSKDVIQNDDKENSKIVGKGVILINWKGFMVNATYSDKITISVECKDGKYRYKVYDMIITVPAGEIYNTYIPPHEFFPEDCIERLLGKGHAISFSKGQATKILQSVDTQTKNTIASLNKVMISKIDTF